MDYKGDIYYINEIKEGSVNAFSFIVNRHKDHIFNLIFRITGNREEAEELAQDTFMKAFRSLGSFRMKSTFSTWLYRIAYNTAISHVRSRKKGLLSLDEFPADAVDFIAGSTNEEEAIEEYRSALVNFALLKITEEERAILTLYYYEEMDTETISEISGLSRQNVKVKLFRVRQKMNQIITEAEKKNIIYHEDR